MASTTENAEPALAGLLAQFAGPAELVEAARSVREAGYRRWDAHSPYPVHGIERAMGIRPTILPWLVLGAGVVGGAVAIGAQWWMNAVDYPLPISGKPLFSLPANIPVAFELIVLLAALAAFLGVLGLNGLPRFSHPVFSSRRFARATTDGFFLSIEADDPRFDADATRQLLQSLEPVAIEECYEQTSGRELPKGLAWVAAFAVVLAAIPPLWIARTRAVPSGTPRLHLVKDMDFQPRYQSQAASPLFGDGLAMRPAIAGTIADGQLEANEHFTRGKIDGKDAATLPVAVDEALMRRGRERYGVFCATCHGLAGDGDGMTALRVAQGMETRAASYPNWVPPQSLHKPSVVAQAAGKLFQTITSGMNTMPGYAAQIRVADRWAIVAYVRALQRTRLSQPADVPEDKKQELR